MWQRRRTIEICQQFMKEAAQADTDTGYMLGDLENCVKDITVNSQAEPIKTMGEIVTRVLGNSKKTRDTGVRSEEHTSELQSLMRISYAVFCSKKKKKHN